MAYWMYALNENGEYNQLKGDSGGMSLALYYDDARKIQIEKNAEPRVGVAMRIGSLYARSYSGQDWWQTTTITEIQKEWIDDENRKNVIFKTQNSVYHWKSD